MFETSAISWRQNHHSLTLAIFIASSIMTKTALDSVTSKLTCANGLLQKPFVMYSSYDTGVSKCFEVGISNWKSGQL